MRNKTERCYICNNYCTTQSSLKEGRKSLTTSYCRDCCLSSNIPYNAFLNFLLLSDFNTAMDNIKSYARVLRKYFRKTEEEVYQDFINKLNPRRCNYVN